MSSINCKYSFDSKFKNLGLSPSPDPPCPPLRGGWGRGEKGVLVKYQPPLNKLPVLIVVIIVE